MFDNFFKEGVAKNTKKQGLKFLDMKTVQRKSLYLCLRPGCGAETSVRTRGQLRHARRERARGRR